MLEGVFARRFVFLLRSLSWPWKPRTQTEGGRKLVKNRSWRIPRPHPGEPKSTWNRLKIAPGRLSSDLGCIGAHPDRSGDALETLWEAFGALRDATGTLPGRSGTLPGRSWGAPWTSPGRLGRGFLRDLRAEPFFRRFSIVFRSKIDLFFARFSVDFRSIF